MRICVVDTETTGLDPQKDRVCELAAVELLAEPWRLGPTRHGLVNPGRSIPVAASAVHHIQDKDVKYSWTLPEAIKHIVLPAEVDVLVAHNAQFDRAFLSSLDDKPWICSYRCARHLVKESPGYGLQVLRYFLGIELLCEEGRAAQPHAAIYDALTAAHLMVKLLQMASVEELIDLTGKPLLLRRVPFGKYKGKDWDKVPKDYLAWLKRRPDLDSDLRHTLSYYLAEES